jgi:hypothetical protein
MYFSLLCANSGGKLLEIFSGIHRFYHKIYAFSYGYKIINFSYFDPHLDFEQRKRAKNRNIPF